MVSKNISEAAGFESKGKILLDKKGAPISSSSIMLTREDWLRFGMYVGQLMKDKNSCEGKKLQEAFENATPTKKICSPICNVLLVKWVWCRKFSSNERTRFKTIFN